MYAIYVANGGKWQLRSTLSSWEHGKREGKAIESENEALRAYGIRPTNAKTGARGRCRLGEAVSKSGKRFKAVKVA
jgi:hypothetical protein